MDIQKDFATSFNQLMKHKIIIIPTLISLLIPLALIIAYLHISGLNKITRELSELSNQYEKEKETFFMKDYNISNTSSKGFMELYKGSDDYKNDFSRYLAEKGFLNKIMGIMNVQNIVILIIFIFIALTSMFYLSCVSFALITLNIKNENLNLSNTMKLANKFSARLFSLQLLLFLIIIIPILLAALIIISFFFVNVILGGISMLVFIILIIIYLIITMLRLCFSIPIAFVEDKPAFSSIKQSYYLTRHHLRGVFIIAVIIYGTTIFTNSLAGSPLKETFSALLLSDNASKFIVTLLIVTIFILIEAFMLTFENLFLFYSYIDFKEVIK